MSVLINGKTEANYLANFIHKEIEAPEPKLEFVEIPLRDGHINASAFLSDHVFYGPRKIVIGMELRSLRKDWPLYWSQLLDDLHGREVMVEFSDDPGWVWSGTAIVGSIEDHGASAGVTIEVTAQPFKVQREKTEFWSGTITTASDYSAEIPIDYMRAYPIFTTSAAGVTVTYNGETWTLPQGESTCYGLVLARGTNELTFHGAADVAIDYKGGQL